MKTTRLFSTLILAACLGCGSMMGAKRSTENMSGKGRKRKLC